MESRLLRVNLSTNEIKTEVIPHAVFERWDWRLGDQQLDHVGAFPEPRHQLRSPWAGQYLRVRRRAAGRDRAGIGVKGRITFKSPCYGILATRPVAASFPMSCASAAMTILP